jgi:hypothetical protein
LLISEYTAGWKPTVLKIAAVAVDLVKNDRRIASRMIAESLNKPKTVVLWILREDFCSRYLFLLHDNAPAHETASVCQLLTPKNVTTLFHSPYFPDLSPPDYFLFPNLKMKLQGLHFADVAEVQEAVTDELRRFKKRNFQELFRKCTSSQKPAYMPMKIILNKKVMCHPRVF